MLSNNLNLSPDVKQVLDYFHKKIRKILGKNIVGMYVYGSLAMGDFDADVSDIDFIVITKSLIEEGEFLRLDKLHKQFYSSRSKWAKKIEAAYITQDALKRYSDDAILYPQIEKGKDLSQEKLEMGWAFQCYTLREHGIVVAGPDPKTLFPPVDISHMIKSAKSIAAIWYEQAHDEKESAFLKEESEFVIMTLSRFLYLIHTKKVASKSLAIKWARENLDKKWVNIIDQILSHKNNRKDDFQNIVKLIKYTVDSC